MASSNVQYCHCHYRHPLFLFWSMLGLGLGASRVEKKTACPARVAVAGQENIETVHEPEPIQTVVTLCMDKVAVL